MAHRPSQDFLDLEKEALQERNLNSSLVKAFKKLHEEQLEIFEEHLSTLEEEILRKVKIAVKTQCRDQLKESFRETLEECQTRIWLLISPLVKRSENDLKRLETSVSDTESLCQSIQNKYRLRWGVPFITLILVAAWSGALIGIMVFVWLLEKGIF